LLLFQSLLKNNFFVVNENKCTYLVLYKAEIADLENLKFNKIFKSNECMKMIQSARLAKLKDKNFLFMSAAADIFINNEIDDRFY